jgi:hypothetical protein
LRRRGLSPNNLDRMTVGMSRKGHLNIGWPYRLGEVIAAQMNGSYAADRPLSRDEVEMKFRRFAAVALPPSAIEELIGLVETIEREPDVSRLATLTTTAA